MGRFSSSSSSLVYGRLFYCRNQLWVVWWWPFYGCSKLDARCAEWPAGRLNRFNQNLFRFVGQRKRDDSFSIPQKGCGTTTSPSAAAAAATSTTNRKSFNPFQRALDVRPHPIQQQVVPVSDDVSLENTIIVQHDPDFQEAGDMARRLRCFWRNSLQKSVNAKMPEVYQPSLVSRDILSSIL